MVDVVDVTVAVDVYVEVIVDVYVAVYVAVSVEVMVVEVVAFSANTKTLKSSEERPKPPQDKSMLHLYADLDLEDLQQKGIVICIYILYMCDYIDIKQY